MNEQQERAAVVAEVRSWVNTPYHHEGDIKGSGVDCGMLLVRTFCDLGLVPLFDPRPYPADWNLHRNEEKYLSFLSPRARLTTNRDPGNVVIWHHGRTFSHAGIITQWPKLVHAYYQSMIVEECNYENELRLQFLPRGVPRPMLFYSLWEKDQ